MSSFRMGSGDLPSSPHNSDSDETWNHKVRWKLVAWWVWVKWVRFVIHNRWARRLLRGQLLPLMLRKAIVTDRIGWFIGDRLDEV